jgi:hypothetical protein
MRCDMRYDRLCAYDWLDVRSILVGWGVCTTYASSTSEYAACSWVTGDSGVCGVFIADNGHIVIS